MSAVTHLPEPEILEMKQQTEDDEKSSHILLISHEQPSNFRQAIDDTPPLMVLMGELDTSL
jgi:hypothetical protein